MAKYLHTARKAEEAASAIDLMDTDQQEKFASIFLQKLEDDFNGHVIVFFRDKAKELIDNYEKKGQ